MQPAFLGSNLNLVKTHNLQAILMTLLHEKNVSRIELAQRTSLSTTTITNLIAELQEQGIVIDEGPQSNDDQPRLGRPRTLLQLVPEARYVVGVHIGIGVIRVAVTNLFARVLHNNLVNYDIHSPADEVLELIAALVESTIVGSGIELDRLLGVGVGASGLVNFETGMNVFAPALGWHNVPVRDMLEKRLNLRVVVDNNVRIMALGEAFFGAGRGVKSLAFVYGRIGVGAGFVFNGRVFRGSRAGAGEIGHTIMVPHGGSPCRCGKKGCLETLISEPVLIKEAEALAQRNPRSRLAQTLSDAGDIRSIEQVFSAARQGDAIVREMISERACYLGVALANLVNILNPELLLLGGVFSQGEDLILPAVTQAIRETAFAGLGEEVTVKSTSFGWRAGVVGAASLALTEFFYQEAQFEAI